MRIDRIDFISAYCDRWCERCGYTSRCSAFAVQAALGMGGDFREALQLAVGAPQPVEGASRDRVVANDWADAEIDEPSERELTDLKDQETARHQRVYATSIMKNANAIVMIAHRWFASRPDAVGAMEDNVLVGALEVVRWDSTLIGAKLARALSGRDRRDQDGECDDDPIQNDWNGSAKVGLISIDRSVEAWRVIAHATGDAAAAGLAAAMADLRRLVEKEFPAARSFIRPGFDEPHC